jgi:RimJ/RimL family protein N-acetyltransferase
MRQNRRMDVELRDVTPEDVEVFYEQQLDPEARRVAVFPLREHDAFVTHWRDVILANDSNLAWTVVAGGEVAGNMLCFERDGKREVGYWLGQAYWGKGIATEALSLLLREVSERPLYAHVARSNVGSIRVLEKCGFTEIGAERHVDEAMGEEIEEALLELR